MYNENHKKNKRETTKLDHLLAYFLRSHKEILYEELKSTCQEGTSRKTILKAVRIKINSQAYHLCMKAPTVYPES